MNPIIAANWKMNLTKIEAANLINQVNETMDALDSVNLIISPSHCYLDLVQSALRKGAVAAQNVSEYKGGAYTGEISAQMAKSCGASYVILGHSERRHVFHESNEMIFEKLNLCYENDLIPIVCVGETLEERKSGQLKTVINNQLDILTGIDNDYLIAYEPVWAIGTGETATPELAEEVHAYIRSSVGDSIPILYGGSVNAKNIEGLLKMPNINGALIGGASLKVDEFSQILTIATTLERVSK
tara:strand:+ start:4256 stop:4984 length:729 start_codon:yes stop_codon:yes gene_type:complete